MDPPRERPAHPGRSPQAAPRPRTEWERIDDEQCRRATTALEFVGKRWNGAILLALRRGATRFSEILASVIGLSDRLLAVRLRELEHAGLVRRDVEPTTPVTIRYALTQHGTDLLDAIEPLALYGQRWTGSRD
jgi:DNA-binding HxlR family transcriptional regulator